MSVCHTLFTDSGLRAGVWLQRLVISTVQLFRLLTAVYVPAFVSNGTRVFRFVISTMQLFARAQCSCLILSLMSFAFLHYVSDVNFSERCDEDSAERGVCCRWSRRSLHPCRIACLYLGSRLQLLLATSPQTIRCCRRHILWTVSVKHSCRLPVRHTADNWWHGSSSSGGGGGPDSPSW